MNTANVRQRGFVMLIIIAILALIATYMIILASDMNIFAFQSDRAYLEACRQNLTASGLVWARKNVNALKNTNSTVDLDTAAFGIKNSALSVKLLDKSQVEIKTFCTKARQRLSSDKKFTIETRI